MTDFEKLASIAAAMLLFCAVIRPAFAGESAFPRIEGYLGKRAAEFGEIPEETKTRLKKVSQYVKTRIDAGEPANLVFVCTHNSRRSHLAQIWAAAAASHYGIDRVRTFSGGTEATAFNPRAIAALQRAGLRIERVQDGTNPRYAVRFRDTDDPLICFSKVYDQDPNPKKDFCAVLVCSQADKACPNVAGAALRVAIPYDDPKLSDGTPEESATYDERSRQICREMLYVFSQVEKSEKVE